MQRQIYAMMKLKYESMQYERSLPLDAKTASTMNSRDFCYAVLNKVSRSFALVIQELPEELRHPVCFSLSPSPSPSPLLLLLPSMTSYFFPYSFFFSFFQICIFYLVLRGLDTVEDDM